MSEDIRQDIRDMSQKISEEYLLFKKDMNENLISMVKEGSIKNDQILRRVCEQSNQNVYLSMFNDNDAERANITFDVADFQKVSSISKENEGLMKNYNTPPKDFRSSLEVSVSKDVEKTASDSQELAEIKVAIEQRQTLKNFRSNLEIMKTAEVASIEQSVNDMSRDTMIMVSNGESISDIAKIATRFVKEKMEGDFVKVAMCYDYIDKNLKEKGFKAKRGFTKVSSFALNGKSETLTPVKVFAEAIAKIAGLEEMHGNVSRRIEVYDKVINERAKKYQ